MSDNAGRRPEVPTSEQMASGARRGGTAVGIVLVIVGAIMLFGRYVAWFDLFRLWPLIIVIGGIAQVFRSHGNEPPIKRVAEGVGSIMVGLVLLGNTLGYIPWTVWITMLSLWPLLLVALGIELLGRGLGLPWVRALSNVALILGLFYGVFVLQPGTWGPALTVPGVSASNVPYSDSAPHDASIREGTLAIKAGAARLTVGAGPDLARISGRAPSDVAPRLEKTVTSGVAVVLVDEPSRHTFVFGVQDRTMDLMLDRDVVWKRLGLDIGAVQADADLRELQVRDISVNVGASDLRLTVGSRTDTVNVDISGGAANITLRVPANAAVTLESKSGLSSVNVPAGFRRVSGVPIVGESSWVSEGSGGPRISVSMQSGVSNLNVETY